MRPLFHVLLMVPGLLFKFVGVYFSFRRRRWSYLRSFSRTVKASIGDKVAASEIIKHQKGILKIPFSKLITSMLSK